MSKAKGWIAGLIVVLAIFGVSKAIGYSLQDRTPMADNSTNRAALMRIEVESCVREAKKTAGNIYTDAQIQQYCGCVADDLLGDKTMEEINQFEKDYNDSLTITPEMEASINKCAAQL